MEPDETTDEGKRENKALVRKKLAISNMTMESATSSLMNKVYKARTVQFPGGLAYVPIDNLLKEHQPKDDTSKVKDKVKLLEIKMQPDGDLNEIFEEISKAENEHNDELRTLDKDDLTAVALHTENESCMSVLTSEMRLKGDVATLHGLKEAMNQH